MHYSCDEFQQRLRTLGDEAALFWDQKDPHCYYYRYYCHHYVSEDCADGDDDDHDVDHRCYWDCYFLHYLLAVAAAVVVAAVDDGFVVVVVEVCWLPLSHPVRKIICCSPNANHEVLIRIPKGLKKD